MKHERTHLNLRWVVALAFAALAIGGSGCASTVKYFCEGSATTNTIVRINSSPQGATGKMSNGRTVTTPVQMALKSDEAVDIVFSKEGYESVEVRLGSWINPWLLGDIIAGGPIGLLYDLEQGATSTILPSDVYLELKPSRGLTQ